MSEQRVLFLQKSLIGSGALAAFALLVSFYTVVHGAVDRAHHRATDLALQSTGTPAAPASVHSALLARAGN